MNALTSHVLQNYLGDTCRAAKHFRAAKQVLKKRKGKREEIEEVWKQVVKFLVRFNQLDFALEVLQNVQIDKQWRAFFRAKVLNAQKKFKESCSSLETVEEEPLCDEALLLKAKNLYFLFKNFEAEENLLRYIRKKSNSIGADNMVFLGLIFMQRKNFDCAEQIFAKVVHKAPKSALVWYLLGSCLANNGHWLQAEEAFLKSREIDTHFSDTILGLFHVRIHFTLKVD